MLDVLLSDQERALRDEVREFVRKVPASLVRAMDADEVRYPREYVRDLGRAGLLGLRFPPRWGGRGLSWTAEVVALAEIGVLGSSLGCLYSLPSIVGEALVTYGTDEQRERYLRPTLAGELCCAEALTEPRGGSDFFGATTRAERRGDVYLLTGQKRFVVGAEGADYFLVYAKTDPDAPPHRSLSLFIVEREMGVEVKHIYGLLGTRGGGAGRILFRETPVPVANRIGPENAGGQIFDRMMIPERLTSAAAVLGPAAAALDIAVRYTDRRRAFGQPIRRFQAVSFKVADSIAALDAAAALVYAAARTVDLGRPHRRIVSEAKMVATETAWQVVNDAMQMLGGIGYTDVFPVERFLRDGRLALIWTGTNEIMRLLIQHEYYREVLEGTDRRRDVEADARSAEAVEEKLGGEEEAHAHGVRDTKAAMST